MRLKILFLIGLGLVTPISLAQIAVSYTVNIEAPADVKPLLERYLDSLGLKEKRVDEEDNWSYLLDAASLNTTNLLATQGYFSPKVSVVQNAAQKTIKILVQPGPQTRVNQVHIGFSGALKNDRAFAQYQEKIDRAWSLPSKHVFTQAGWDEAKIRGLLTLSREKYAKAKIADSQASIYPEEKKADLTITYDSGPIYSIGEVHIIGLKTYPEKVVRNQIRIKPGEYYSQEKLLDIQSTLQNFPHFVSAVVEADFKHEHMIDKDHIQTPLIVSVQEAPLQKFNIGLGYSTERALRGELFYQHNNVAKQGWVLAAQIKRDKLEKIGSLVLTVPKRGSGYDDSFYVRQKESNIENLFSRATSIGTQRTRKKGLIETALVLDYTTELQRFFDGSSTKPHALGLSYEWIRRDLDDIANPRSGNMLWLEGGGAIEGLLSNTSFLSLHGTGVVYWKLGQKDTLISRMELGQVLAGNDLRIPSRWLFRAGGSNSVRGYKYNALGVNRRGSIVDGRVVGTATVEYQRIIYDAWRAAFFVDAGDAAKNWKTYRMHKGVGVGARWASPVGMFGADLAYGFQSEGGWRVYLSMGLMF